MKIFSTDFFFTILGFAISAVFILPNFISKQESLAFFIGMVLGYAWGKFQSKNFTQPQGATPTK